LVSPLFPWQKWKSKIFHFSQEPILRFLILQLQRQHGRRLQRFSKSDFFLF
jgi:hypothetical protein